MAERKPRQEEERQPPGHGSWDKHTHTAYGQENIFPYPEGFKKVPFEGNPYCHCAIRDGLALPESKIRLPDWGNRVK